MTKTRDRIIIDSCVFVNFLTGGAPKDDPSWLNHSKRIVQAAIKGEVDAFVAAIIIPEVLGNGQVRGSHISKEQRRQRSLKARDWFRGANFTVVELSAPLAFESGIQAQGSQLHGADATIYQSAIIIQANAIYTWDKGLLKLDGTNGMRVLRPSEYVPPGGRTLLDEISEI